MKWTWYSTLKMWIANLYLITTFVADIRKSELSDTQYKHTEFWSEENVSYPDLKSTCQHQLKKNYTSFITNTLLTTVLSHVKIKVSLTRHGGSERNIVIGTLIFNLRTRWRWVLSVTPRTFSQEIKALFAWWVQNWSGVFREEQNFYPFGKWTTILRSSNP